MVHVHLRISPPAVADEIDELLEGALFREAIDAPESTGSLFVVGHPAPEEILEAAAGLEERVALHIEEDVARGRLRKESKSEWRLVPDQLVDRLRRPPRAQPGGRPAGEGGG